MTEKRAYLTALAIQSELQELIEADGRFRKDDTFNSCEITIEGYEHSLYLSFGINQITEGEETNEINDKINYGFIFKDNQFHMALYSSGSNNITYIPCNIEYELRQYKDYCKKMLIEVSEWHSEETLRESAEEFDCYCQMERVY